MNAEIRQAIQYLAYLAAGVERRLNGYAGVHTGILALLVRTSGGRV